MVSLNNEIIILIDISSFCLSDDALLGDLIDHVKEAVSLQISRGAVTNRKLVRLGMEPYLARVKWTYSFFDSACDVNNKQVSVQPMQTLTYECWDMFEEELNQAVKSYSSKNTGLAQVSTRVSNIVQVLNQLKFSGNSPAPNVTARKSSDHTPPIDFKSTSTGITPYNNSPLIFVFTGVPNTFSYLVHLATGVSDCKSVISTGIQCNPCEVQICFVDVKCDSLTLQKHSSLDSLPCFWDDFFDGSQKSCQLSLKVSCLKKIMMVLKLMELRFPWMYESSLRLPFGFGMGMKRLRQWEWRIPTGAMPRSQGDQESRCLPLRKCLSEELY